jgi:hypothetical protein
MKKIIFILSVVSLFSSCVEDKYIFKNDYIARIKTTANTSLNGGQVITVLPTIDSLNLYKVDHCFTKCKIENKGDYLIIREISESNIHCVRRLLLKGAPIQWKKDLVNKYYFPEMDSFPTAKKLVYLDSKPVLQGIAITLKIRPKLNESSRLDSFPSQTETGFNPAIAVGWKFNYNIFKPKKDFWGRNLNQFSLTPGIFLGTGAVDLKKSNTRNPIIKFERKAAILSTGGFIMFGYNNINLGYSFGFDYATGTGKNSWLYQGKMWQGITIGIDIIK